MVKLDHLTIPVRDHLTSRDWYVRNLGMKVDFEAPDRRTTALQDDSGLTLFLEEAPQHVGSAGCILYFQVDDIEAKHRQLSDAGIPFVHPPQKEYWGYGAELRDPDGYRIRLWDEKSMREKGQ